MAAEIVEALHHGGGISCEFPSLASAPNLH